MKKSFVLVVLSLVIALLSACGGDETTTTTESKSISKEPFSLHPTERIESLGDEVYSFRGFQTDSQGVQAVFHESYSRYNEPFFVYIKEGTEIYMEKEVFIVEKIDLEKNTLVLKVK